MSVAVALRVDDPRWEGLQAWSEQAAEAVAARLLGAGDWEVSVLGCDDAAIAALNTDFRGKPTATNVLSWPSEERGADVAGAMPDLPDADSPWDAEWGDIAIAFETCAAEAETQGKAFDAHVRHLLVHGMLHLLGFDHENDPDADLMEGLEVEILASMGICNPYLEITGGASA